MAGIKTSVISNMHPQPAVFVSHGAPTYAMFPGKAGAQLSELGRRLTAGLNVPKAIVILSPHWMTHEVQVCTAQNPRTIHDFGGFPAPLYKMRYPAMGSPLVAARVIELLQQASIPVTGTDSYGFDHGAWVPMMHLLPQANISTLQVSLPGHATPSSVLAMGAALKPLLQEGVLILGSGSLTHNLYEIERDSIHVASYVQNFQQWIRDALLSGHYEKIVNANTLAPDFARAHPSTEHFLPLLFTLGASSQGNKVEVLAGGIEHHVLSMESYVFGMNS
jgi:4,5-DOPA dioxygenase extradiol